NAIRPAGPEPGEDQRTRASKPGMADNHHTLVAGYLLAAKKPSLAAFTIGAVAGGATISTLLKLTYARTRPDVVEHLVDIDSASFPSGHAMNSAVTYLTLAVLGSRAEKSATVRRYLISM